MKTTLEFTLPEERCDLEDAINGSSYKNKIGTLYDQVFRPHIKYEKPIIGNKLTEMELEIIQTLWLKVHEHFQD